MGRKKAAEAYPSPYSVSVLQCSHLQANLPHQYPLQDPRTCTCWFCHRSPGVQQHSVPQQHSFRKYRSCETHLLEFIEEVSAALESGMPTDVIIMDFAEAFDRVNHSLLVHKTQPLQQPRKHKQLDRKLPS